jgi:hypothetical protein
VCCNVAQRAYLPYSTDWWTGAEIPCKLYNKTWSTCDRHTCGATRRARPRGDAQSLTLGSPSFKRAVTRSTCPYNTCTERSVLWAPNKLYNAVPLKKANNNRFITSRTEAFRTEVSGDTWSISFYAYLTVPLPHILRIYTFKRYVLVDICEHQPC